MTDTFSNSPEDGSGPRRQPGDDRKTMAVPTWFAVTAGALLLATFVIVVVLFVRDDSATVETVDSTTTSLAETTTTELETTTTEESTTTTEATTSTSESTTTSTSSTTTNSGSTTPTVPAEYATAVWPWFVSTVRYTDPVDAAMGFALDFVGFEEPLAGEFQEGDSRSGEVEIQPTGDGPATTVFVRQLGADGSWWVLGSASENIVVEEPQALCMIESPLTLKGEALSFEGNVEVQVRADGVTDPLAVTPVTGGGSELLPFEGDVSFTSPGVGSGSLLFLSRSAKDGGVWEASVLRVSFVPSAC